MSADMAATFLRLADVDVDGKHVFIRADLNVPLDGQGAISDDTRIRASVPAIRDALSRGAATMVTSHLGRPSEGRFSAADSLAPIAKRLAELLGRPVRIETEAGAAEDSPARREAAERARRLAEAEQTIQNDPLVQALMAQYTTARIVPGSVRSL